MTDEEIQILQEKLEQLKEDLFLSQTDLEVARTENIALRNFVQNIYESCEGMDETTLSLSEILDNLKQNIQKFSKEYRIRL